MKINQALQQTRSLLSSLEQQHGAKRISINDVPADQQALVTAATAGAASFTVADVRRGVSDGFDALVKADSSGFPFRSGRNNGVLEAAEAATAARQSPVASPLYTLIGARLASAQLTMEAAAKLPPLTPSEAAPALRALGSRVAASASMSEALDLLRGSPDLLRAMDDGGRYAVARRVAMEAPLFSSGLAMTEVSELVLQRRGATIEVYVVDEPFTNPSGRVDFVNGGVAVPATCVTHGEGTLLPPNGSKDSRADDFFPSDMSNLTLRKQGVVSAN